MNKKRVICVIGLVLILAVLVVGLIHATTTYLPAPLRIWQKDALAEAAGKESFDKFTNLMDIDDHFSYAKDRYYGKYNGYYILSETVPLCFITTVTIGEYDFELNGRNLKAYKDGAGMDLADAYKRGYISDKDLAKIYGYHTKMEEAYWDYMESLRESS